MRRGFTLLELIFVIVVMGILAKFGTNILVTTYQSYATSVTNTRLQFNTELALKQIANRLQYRIKDSVVAGVATPLATAGGGETTLQWIGYDIDGWLGNAATWTGAYYQPTWSGFIDVNADPTGLIAPPTGFLNSPATNVVAENTVIQALRANGSATNFNADAAIFFTGENSSTTTYYGWGGVARNTQINTSAHRVGDTGAPNQLMDTTGATFAGTDVYENYKLAWTAYAIETRDFDGDGDDDLVLSYDFQPWTGDTLANGTAVLLLHNVDTFTFQAVGSSIQIEVCTHEQNLLGGGQYAICKETAIF